MNTNPETPQPGPATAAQGQQRSTWVLVTTAVVGGVVLLAGIGVAAFSGVASLANNSSEEQSVTVDARGVHELDIETSSSNFLIVFDGLGGPDSAQLEVEGGTREWTMRRDDDSLVVESERLFAFDWFSFGIGSEQEVVLHLPASMREQAIDADLDISSGSLRIDAEFGEIDATVSSGTLTILGSAQSIDARLSSGVISIELADVNEGTIDVSSGMLRGELTGAAPRELDVRVNSGSADLTMPDTSYAVTSQVSSGWFDNQLRTDSSSKHTIEVDLSSGKVNLRPGR